MSGGGAGHIADMIARFRDNYALLNKNANYKRIKKYIRSKDKTKINISPLTDKERIALNQQMKLRNQRERKHTLFISCMALILTAVILFLVQRCLHAVYF